MAVISEIPLSATPQTFTFAMNDVNYLFRLIYCDVPEGGWLMDISKTDKTPIVCGIPLVPGVDLLAQYAYIGFGGQLRVVNDNDPSAAPAFDQLGSTAHLLWITA